MSISEAFFCLAATALTIVSSLPATGEPASVPLWFSGPPDSAIVHDRAKTITNRDSEQNSAGLNRSIDFVSEPSVTVFPAADSGWECGAERWPAGRNCCWIDSVRST